VSTAFIVRGESRLTSCPSPSAKIQEERILHEAKLSKMEAEMKMVFQQKVQEKESKLKQSEEELYARHKEMKDALDKQRADLEDKKRRIESGRPLTPEKNTVSRQPHPGMLTNWHLCRPKTVASCGRFSSSWYFFRIVLSSPLLVCRLVPLLSYIALAFHSLPRPRTFYTLLD
jgi:hypothetical protein